MRRRLTHNPNIIDKGDAKFMAAMNFKAGQCRVILENK